ncbi:MAG: hypothetical protein V4738_10035 [Pseudomonadota bacterium]
MKVISLACTGCSAPLTIQSHIDTFACGYCGISLQVERSGGVVALHKVENAIRAVQSGTDRTAAELALKRLKNELVGARTARDQLKQFETEKVASVLRGRFKLTLLIAIAVFAFSNILALIIGIPSVVEFAAYISFIAAAAASYFVYKKIKVPKINHAELTRLSLEVANIESQIVRNREILRSAG